MTEREEEELEALKQAAVRELGGLPGVVGIGLGAKETGGRITGAVAIRVYVERKRPVDELAPEDRIPSEFRGVPTDVLVAPPPGLDGCLHPPGTASPDCDHEDIDEDSYGRVLGGCSIQIRGEQVDSNLTVEDHQGTLGFVARLTEDVGDTPEGTIVGVTNDHVLMARNVDGLEVWQATVDGSGARRIGTTLPRDSAGGGRVDAALFELEPGLTYSHQILGIGRVRGSHRVTAAEAAAGYPVRKRGMRTGLTYGCVTDAGVEPTGGTSNSFTRAARNTATGGFQDIPMQGQLVARRRERRDDCLNASPNDDVFISCGGDSGSAMVNEHDEIVGLHWKSGGVASPIRLIEQHLRIELMTPANSRLDEQVPLPEPSFPERMLDVITRFPVVTGVPGWL